MKISQKSNFLSQNPFLPVRKQKAWIRGYKSRTSLRLVMRVYHHTLPWQHLYYVFTVWLLFHILLFVHLLFLIFPSLSSKVIIKYFLNLSNLREKECSHKTSLHIYPNITQDLLHSTIFLIMPHSLKVHHFSVFYSLFSNAAKFLDTAFIERNCFKAKLLVNPVLWSEECEHYVWKCARNPSDDLQNQEKNKNWIVYLLFIYLIRTQTYIV